jgi:hypothetical protein
MDGGPVVFSWDSIVKEQSFADGFRRNENPKPFGLSGGLRNGDWCGGERGWFAFVVVESPLEADAAAGKAHYFGGGKSKAIFAEVFGGIVSCTFPEGQFGEEDGFFPGLFARGVAFSLDLLELFLVLFDGAADAVFVKSEGLDVFAVGEPDARLTDGGEDFGGVAGGGVGDGTGGHADGKDIVFEGTGPVETPLVLGDGGGQPRFAVVGGFEVRGDAGAVVVEGGAVFFGEGVELAGDGVAAGVDVALAAAGLFFFGLILDLVVGLLGVGIAGGGWICGVGGALGGAEGQEFINEFDLGKRWFGFRCHTTES